MKLYRDENAPRTYIKGKREDFTRAGFIVWLGSGECWYRVFLCKTDHRLYIQYESRKFAPLDEFNIRKIMIEEAAK